MVNGLNISNLKITSVKKHHIEYNIYGVDTLWTYYIGDNEINWNKLAKIINNDTFKIVSVKTNQILNDYNAGEELDNFNIDSKVTYVKNLPHKATFHPNTDFYHPHSTFIFKFNENFSNVQIINILSGMKVTESQDYIQERFLFPAGFTRADDNTFFTIEYTTSGSIRILNENTGNYLVERISRKSPYFQYFDAIFIKNLTSPFSNTYYNSEFKLVCLTGCKLDTNLCIMNDIGLNI